MSGFAVVCHADAAPVARGLLAELAAFLAAPGDCRDGVRIRVEGPIGLVQALRAPAAGREPAEAPRDEGAGSWLVADVRLDARDELRSRLGLAGAAAPTEEADLALLGRAWARWGEGVVAHLRGDYSLVAWEPGTRRLFAARDPFGVRPLYHARAGATWIFSNRLDCVRLHPGVGDELNRAAVLDGLLLDCNQELDTTVFAAVRRLPPAHTATLAGGSLAVRRHWSVPEPAELLWRPERELLAEFRWRLEQAARDRRRPGGTAIWLSGGLDSTTLAAAGAPGLAAVTAVYDRLIPDRERQFAGAAARALGLPIEFVVADDVPLFEGWDRPERRTAEPQSAALAGVDWRTYAAAAARGCVVWYGEGGDEILPTRTVRQLARHLRGRDLGRGVLEHLWRRRRLPPLGTGLIDAWRRLIRPGESAAEPAFPAWLAPEAAGRADLRARFAAWHRTDPGDTGGRCGSRFQPALWSQLLEECAEKGDRCGLEVALPYLDQRVVELALRLPPYPWTADKFILRRLGRGRLPDEVLARPKTGLEGDPAVARLCTRADWRALEDRVPLPPELEEFVAIARWREGVAAGSQDAWTTWINLRPLDLAVWMQTGRTRPRTPTPERVNRFAG